MTALVTIARLEFVAAARLKWIRLLGVAFAALAAASAYAAGAAGDVSGADGFARTTMALVPVAIILVPLAAVILAVAGQSADAGCEAYLFGQPVDRSTVFVGRWAGELAALAAAIGLGFGAGGAVVITAAGSAGAMSFVWFVLLSVALAAIFLSIAAAIAAASDRRGTALGVGVFAWFASVLLYDGVALSAAGWVTGPAGGRVLFVSIFGNPADLVRVAMLLVAGTNHVLGATGEAWTRFLGGDRLAALAAGAAIVAWMIAPLGVGVLTLRARDL
jgi:ABC-2 type transport system permease protein